MLTAAQVNQLREKTRAELARRGGFGSLAGFAGTEYDFETVPRPGGQVLAEHGQKTINPLLAVTDIPGLVLVGEESPEGGVPSGKGDPIPKEFDETLLSHVEVLAAEPMQGAQSSCRGACSGLCAGSCVGSCSGCGASCSSSCSGCSGCGGSCTGCSGCSGCGSSCAGGCSGCSGCGSGCSGGCGGGCAATCGTTCTATCYGNCQGQCYGTAAAAVSV